MIQMKQNNKFLTVNTTMNKDRNQKDENFMKLFVNYQWKQV